ncbi:hypothetical protein AUP68_02045 [Ilyonectria robusta]
MEEHSDQGYKRCCGRLLKIGRNLNKHMVRHTRPRPCKAGAGCDYGAASMKDLNRHYWSHHKVWAEENSIPDERCKCDACHKSFARKDHKTRHLRKFPECREKLGLPTE